MGLRYTTGLVVLQAFSAWGVQYEPAGPEGPFVEATDDTPGTMVSQATADTWPDSTLANRLEHKFLKYAPIPVRDTAPEPTEEEEDAANPHLHPEVLDTYTKQQLVDFAKAEFAESAEALSLNHTKADLLLAVKTLIAEATAE